MLCMLVSESRRHAFLKGNIEFVEVGLKTQSSLLGKNGSFAGDPKCGVLLPHQTCNKMEVPSLERGEHTLKIKSDGA